MTEVLGYPRYCAQGGDWGSVVTAQLGREYPDSLYGIHLSNALATVAPDDPSEEAREWLRASTAYRALESDYGAIQRNKPQTVAFALSDNPLGAAAWMAEKFKSWTDSGDDLDKTLTKDQILTNIMIYLVTGSEATGVWFYRGNADDRASVSGKVNVPTGFAAFPKEMTFLHPPRSVLEKNYNLVRYTEMPRGGHFACLEQPKLFIDEVRAFFRGFRT
jgi:microsomal epoxide hydrolase